MSSKPQNVFTFCERKYSSLLHYIINREIFIDASRRWVLGNQIDQKDSREFNLLRLESKNKVSMKHWGRNGTTLAECLRIPLRFHLTHLTSNRRRRNFQLLNEEISVSQWAVKDSSQEVREQYLSAYSRIAPKSRGFKKAILNKTLNLKDRHKKPPALEVCY